MARISQSVPGAVVAFALLALIGGCAAGPEISPSEAVRPPGPPPEAPVFALPLDCTELVSERTLDAVLPGDRDLRDSTERSVHMEHAPTVQAGGVSCVWTVGEPGPGPRQAVILTALPDAEAEHETWVDAAGDLSGKVAQRTQEGRQIVSSCSADPAFCRTGTVIDGDWFSVDIMSRSEVAASDIDSVIADIAAAVDSVDRTDPLWSAPGSAITPASLCLDPDAGALLSTAFGVPLRRGDSGTSPDLWGAALERTGADWCSFHSQGEQQLFGDVSVRLQVLPGGSWAVDRALGDPLPTGDAGDSSPVAIPGADAATLACGSAHCTVLVAVDSSAVEFLIQDPELDAATAASRVGAYLMALP